MLAVQRQQVQQWRQAAARRDGKRWCEELGEVAQCRF
jgi:hypothetical protein